MGRNPENWLWIYPHESLKASFFAGSSVPPSTHLARQRIRFQRASRRGCPGDIASCWIANGHRKERRRRCDRRRVWIWVPESSQPSIAKGPLVDSESLLCIKILSDRPRRVELCVTNLPWRRYAPYCTMEGSLWNLRQHERARHIFNSNFIAAVRRTRRIGTCSIGQCTLLGFESVHAVHATSQPRSNQTDCCR